MASFNIEHLTPEALSVLARAQNISKSRKLHDVAVWSILQQLTGLSQQGQQAHSGKVRAGGADLDVVIRPEESSLFEALTSSRSGLDMKGLQEDLEKMSATTKERNEKAAEVDSSFSDPDGSLKVLMPAQEIAVNNSLALLASEDPENEKIITQDDLWLALLMHPQSLELMRNRGLKNDFVEKILAAKIKGGKATLPSSASSDSEETNDNEENPSYLARFSVDLTQRARDNLLDPVVGRDEELRKILVSLERISGHNPLLVGQDGVGKMSIVHSLAQRIASGNMPVNFAGKRILSVNLQGLLSHSGEETAYVQVKAFIKELRSQKDVILAFENAEYLASDSAATSELRSFLNSSSIRFIGATTSGGSMLIEQNENLKKTFSRVVVEEQSPEQVMLVLKKIKNRFSRYYGIEIDDSVLLSTIDLCDRHIKSKPFPEKALDILDVACAELKTSLAGRPQVLEEAELRVIEIQQSIEIATSLQRYSDLRKLKIELQKKTEEVKELTEIFNKEAEIRANIRSVAHELSVQEDKLQDMIEANAPADMAARAKLMSFTIPRLKKDLEEAKKPLGSLDKILMDDTLTVRNIVDVVAEKTKISSARLLGSNASEVLNIDKKLKRKISGQDHAVNAVKNVLVSRMGDGESDKPQGCFLLLGTTGVGKTYLAKSTADAQVRPFLRIDMGEFKESHTVAGLIGSPPGYAGHEVGGRLTNWIKENPNGVILFDEIEKASPDVLKVLLPLLDEGRITGADGETVNAKNCTLFLTGNAGHESILAEYKKILDTGRVTPTKEELKNLESVANNALLEFKVGREFIARLKTVVLLPLSAQVAETITLGDLEAVIEKTQQHSVSFNITEEVVKYLTEHYYSIENGARDIQEGVDDLIKTTLSEFIFGRDPKDPPHRVTLDVVAGELSWSSDELTEEEFAAECENYFTLKDERDVIRSSIQEEYKSVKIQVNKRITDPENATQELSHVPYKKEDVNPGDIKQSVKKRKGEKQAAEDTANIAVASEVPAL